MSDPNSRMPRNNSEPKVTLDNRSGKVTIRIGTHSLVNQEMLPLRQRIMELEGCLVYVKNFLPLALKQHAESVLYHEQDHS